MSDDRESSEANLRKLMDDNVSLPEMPMEKLPESKKCTKKVYQATDDGKGEYRRCEAFCYRTEKFCYAHLTKKRRELLDIHAAQAILKATQKHRSNLAKCPSLMTNLTEELVGARALQDYLRLEITKFSSDKASKEPEKFDSGRLAVIRQATQNLEAISKIAERIYRIREGERRRIDPESVRKIIFGVQEIIKRHVTDNNTLRAIASDMKTLAKEFKD